MNNDTTVSSQHDPKPHDAWLAALWELFNEALRAVETQRRASANPAQTQ